MKPMVEDVGIVGFGMPGQAEQYGPVVRQLFDIKKFEIEFHNPGCKEWLTSNVLTLEGTVGEKNRKFLHEKLDEYLNWFIED